MLRNEVGCKYVVDTSKKGWKRELGKFAMKLKPLVCLECIAGDFTGQMLEFLGFGSTLILYGLLSEEAAGGINTINMIGKG